MMNFLRHNRPSWLAFAAAIIGLTLVYLTTLQTIPNGSEHYFMIDVGETQTVLNVWGTLHATGYPHYVISGAAAVSVLRALGVDAATAPAIVSLLWMWLALGVIYALLRRVGVRDWIAACVIVVYGLTRTVWIHAVIAEIYALTLAICAALYWLALSRAPFEKRLYCLALIGGLGVAHHRAVAMLIPALIVAVWPELIALVRRKPAALIVCLALGLLGFLPYIYLPLRAQAGAPWVYGEPATWAGLWDQFTGREAARFIGAPATFDGLIANLGLVSGVIGTDLSLIGVVLGLIGLALMIRQRETRRAGIMFALGGLTAFAFHAALYTDVLSALILIVSLSLAVGWGALLVRAAAFARGLAAPAITIAAAGILVVANHGFIKGLTTDPTGLQTIALAQDAPPDTTFMLAWGARHFAVGFARDVRGELPNITLVDHKADFAQLLVDGGTLITPEYTFYNQPPEWWQERIGAPITLTAAAPRLVEIGLAPTFGADNPDDTLTGADAVYPHSASLTCDDSRLIVAVEWGAPEQPDRDLSVFVHLLDSGGVVIAQDDQSAPVYRLRPLTSFQSGEIVRDVYALPRLDAGVTVRFGLYEQLPDGAFRNTVMRELPVRCEA